ncbi:MAG TPA: heme-binding protein [Casimicrobiaceae bacterium]|nr:heme-binding protein [Casimicrobiaceae bacterium]
MGTQPVLGHEDAAIAVDTIRDELARRGKAAVIAVADAHGELLALVRLDGAPLSSIAVATNKAWTAARLRRPTRALGAGVRARSIDIGYYGDPRLTGFGGGVPVWAGAHVAGAIAVSALSDEEDEALAMLAIAALAGRGYAADPAA